TTSPSPSNWWLTLMPVISSNAFVSVLDSYSWVGMVSESTLISMPLKGVAASMNHCISFSCSSFESTEGWNSLSIHFFASSTPPKAGAVKKTATATAMTDAGSVRVCIVSSIVFARGSPGFVARTRDFALRTHAMLETKRKSIESQAKANLRLNLALHPYANAAPRPPPAGNPAARPRTRTGRGRRSLGPLRGQPPDDPQGPQRTLRRRRPATLPRRRDGALGHRQRRLRGAPPARHRSQAPDRRAHRGPDSRRLL